MKTPLLIILLPLLLSFYAVRAQPSMLSEVRHRVEEKQRERGIEGDTAYIDLLVRFSSDFYAVNVDSLLYYAQKAHGYAQKIGYQKGEAASLRSMGDFYFLTGNYSKMLSCFQQAYTIADRIGEQRLAANIERNIGAFYLDIGKYDDALANYQKAERVARKAGDSLMLAYVLSDISGTHYERGDYDGALRFSREAFEIAGRLGSEYTEAFVRNDIGKALCAKGLYQESLQYHLPSLQYYIDTHDKLGQTHTSGDLANAYWHLRDTDKALTYSRESYRLAGEIRNKRAIAAASRQLSDIYEARRDYPHALGYFKRYKDFSDSVFNEDTRKKTVEQEARFAYEKKEERLKAEQAKASLLQEHRVQSLQLQVSIAVLAMLLLGVAAISLYNSRAAKHRNNQLLEAKNREILQQNEEIEKQAALLQLSNLQKDRLFSIIAHDLRGPLGSLKSLLYILKENPGSGERIGPMIYEFSRNVDYTAELVNNLLYWAGSQMNGLTVTPVLLQLQPMAEGILGLFARQVADKHIVLRNELDAGLCARGDKDMIELVIRNLVSNAIKFCRPGDTISIQGKRSGSFVEICVKDTGTGIKEEVLDKITRKENITTYGTSKEKGSGLGLPLCREFVEANKGRFRIESEWGRGSCFYFSLPAGEDGVGVC